MPKQITDIDKIRRLPWLALGTLTVNIFMVLAFSGSVFILFLNELGLNKTRIGFLLALIPLCQVLSLFIAPALARFGFKRAYLLFQILRNIAMCFILLTPWIVSRYSGEALFPWVATVIFLFSIGRAVSETAIWPWSQEMVPHRMRGKFIAVNNFITTLAVMITVLAAGFIIGRYEGVGKFIVLISVGLFFGFLSLFFYSMVLGANPCAREFRNRGNFWR
ncbi:MAG: Major Facilitator Superfamily protein [Planctomycetes bacterium ADurb.Bin412]|nr:MAG: Major Facilitator Superfamily protein [Planctomycetes bacterium ADurb.Bin412]